jgi:hypothetical protein
MQEERGRQSLAVGGRRATGGWVVGPRRAVFLALLRVPYRGQGVCFGDYLMEMYYSIFSSGGKGTDATHRARPISQHNRRGTTHVPPQQL